MTTEKMSRLAPNLETTSRPLSIYDNLASSNVPSNHRDTASAPKNDPNEIPYKFHELLPSTNGTTKIANNNNGDSNNKNNIFINTNRDDNDKNYNNETMFNSKGHSINISTNNCNINNSEAPVASELNPSNHQYTNISEVLKLHRTKKISEAKSSFFGLTPKPESQLPLHQTTPGNTNQSVQQQQTPGMDRFDYVPLIGSRKSGPEYQNIPSNSACYNGNSNFNCDSDSNSDEHKVTGGEQPDLSATVFQNGLTEPLVSDNNNQSPSQVVYMSTTVPQNIKGNNIMGRHKPTRNSLRHSRMIVVNKNYKGSQRRNPLDLSYPCLTKMFLIFQICIGICTTILALWVLLWAPNTRTRDNPYWSGIMLIVSGVLGLILIEFKRIPRHKLREHIFTFIRLNSISITVIAVIFTFSALIFAAIHLANVTSPSTTCLPANILTENTACVCLFGTKNATEIVEIKTADEGGISAGGYEFQYKDLSCYEVEHGWMYILIGSVVLNVLGFIFTVAYLSLICCRRKT